LVVAYKFENSLLSCKLAFNRKTVNYE